MWINGNKVKNINFMKKETVLWIGDGMQYSLKDGMSWHLNIPGYKLSEILDKQFNLYKGDLKDWVLDSENLHFKGKELTHNFFSDNVLGVIFDYKKLSEKELISSQEIFTYFQKNFPKIRLLNSPLESALCDSKIEFSKHVSQLPNASSLLPDWKILETEDDLDSAIDSIGYPFLIKPDSLASGKGIVKIADRATALKILKDSREGKYYKSNWRKIKDGVKKVLVNRDFSKPKKTPIKLLINDFVDTYHPKYNCYINATIYYWMGKIFYADVRVSHKGFNIHANDSTNDDLSIDQYREIVPQVMKLIKRESHNLNEMARSINQISVRVDCLINLEEELFKVAEIAIKAGPVATSREKIIPLMEKAGWTEARIREYISGKECSINDLFN
jgi:hypothetical protein